jgi:hypothetical protein
MAAALAIPTNPTANQRINGDALSRTKAGDFISNFLNLAAELMSQHQRRNPFFASP